jgi:mRNA interferase MazF
MPTPGDVVLVPVVGVDGVKPRPAVVGSSALYHTRRPDVVVALLTSQVAKAIAPTDDVLQDWPVANLRRPTAFTQQLHDPASGTGDRAPWSTLRPRLG